MKRLQRRLSRLRAFDRRFKRQGYRRLAGVDEAGRGPLAGPVVAAAVRLRRTTFSVPIDDSKRLTPLARQRAFEQILARAEVGIGILDPATIDTVRIGEASLLAMREAVLRLPKPPGCLLVDGPWRVPELTLPMVPIVRGDSRSLSIACASIVAKVVRDALMTWWDGAYPGYGFARHKGYPTVAHRAALVRLGVTPIHRTTFAPVAEHLANRESQIVRHH